VEGGVDDVAQIMHTHVRKCKNNKERKKRYLCLGLNIGSRK
jgi:hypothetical protein